MCSHVTAASHILSSFGMLTMDLLRNDASPTHKTCTWTVKAIQWQFGDGIMLCVTNIFQWQSCPFFYCDLRIKKIFICSSVAMFNISHHAKSTNSIQSYALIMIIHSLCISPHRGSQLRILLD